MAQYYEGPEDEILDPEAAEGVEEAEEVEGVEAGDQDDEEIADEPGGGAGGGDPLAGIDPEFLEWLKEHDPKAVRKTFEKFTQKWDEVLGKEKQLAPLERLKEAMDNDPGLVRAIEKYYSEGDGTASSEDRIAQVEERLQTIQTQIRIENELSELRAAVKEQGGPEFDDLELIEFARDNMLPSLEAAYKLKYADEIREAAVQKALNGVKANAKAKVETRQKPKEPSGPITLDDLENMSDEDFLAHLRAKSKRRS